MFEDKATLTPYVCCAVFAVSLIPAKFLGQMVAFAAPVFRASQASRVTTYCDDSRPSNPHLWIATFGTTCSSTCDSAAYCASTNQVEFGPES